MPPWLSENLSLIQTITAVVTAFIWLTYLQIIVSGLVRQRRSVLSLNRGGGEGMAAHLLLTNLGAEPLYIRNVLMTLHTDNSTRDVFLTDRREYGPDDLADPLKGTLQGPLEPGAYLDLGTATNIFDRTRVAVDIEDLDAIRKVDIIVLGVGRKLTGASKTYRIKTTGDSIQRLDPEKVATTQLSARQCQQIDARFGSDV